MQARPPARGSLDRAEAVAELAATLPVGDVLTDPDIVERYRHDQAQSVPAGRPVAVVRAGSVEAVQASLRWADRHRISVAPRGAGSGLSGGANAIDGGIVLDVSRMDRIVELDPVEQIAVVEPGVLNADLSRAAAPHDLYYAPDPASREFSTIGGNVATNAGGLCCVKYGVTADHVLGLRAVLADGSLMRTGRRTHKGVTGLDLTRLFVGSEGTLGVIVQVTVRLRPRPPAATTMVAFLPTLDAAGAAITDILASGITPSMLEIMDSTTVAAVDDRLRMDLDRRAAALLLARSDSPGEVGPAETEAMAEICRRQGADYVTHTGDHDEGEALLAARRAAYPALEGLGAILLDDVAVPRARICDLIAAVQDIAARRDVLIGTFGHAGDGNLHPTIVYDAHDPAETEAARAAFEDILTATLRLGGTLTGEHGVGVLKHHRLADELDPVGLRAQRAIKTALDPNGILNPSRAI